MFEPLHEVIFKPFMKETETRTNIYMYHRLTKLTGPWHVFETVCHDLTSVLVGEVRAGWTVYSNLCIISLPRHFFSSSSGPSFFSITHSYPDFFFKQIHLASFFPPKSSKPPPQDIKWSTPKSPCSSRPSPWSIYFAFVATSWQMNVKLQT